MAENDIINDAVEKLGIEQSEEMKEGLKTLMSNIFEKGMLPKDAIGMTPNMIEGIYAHAYRLYNSGKYNQATMLFRMLIMLDPTAPKYPLGLAACYQMAKEYDHAASTYLLVSMLDPLSPLPYYHSSDCYLKLNLPEQAILALQTTIQLCGDQPQYTLIKERSIFTLSGLQNQEKEKEKESSPTQNNTKVETGKKE